MEAYSQDERWQNIISMNNISLFDFLEKKINGHPAL